MLTSVSFAIIGDGLPDEIQEAATALGYNRPIWNYDFGIDASELSWNELTPSQQDAASKLGYTEELWNNDSEIEDR